MNQNHIIAYEYLSQAQDALRNGDRKTAQEFCDLARQTAPDLEEVWLLQASLADPAESVRHLQRALQINPTSERARRGLQWAQNRLGQKTAAFVASQPAEPIEEIQAEPNEPIVEIPIEASAQVITPSIRVQTNTWITLLSVAILIGIIGVGWFYRAEVQRGLSILVGGANTGLTWAPVDPAAPTETPLPTSTQIVINGDKAGSSKLNTQPTSTDLPATLTQTATLEPSPTIELVTVTPDPASVGLPSPTPLPTDTEEPGFVPYATATDAPESVPVSVGNGGKRWIDVNLTTQMVYAYEGDVLVNSFLASTGTWEHPTVTGQYNIYVKYPYTDMSGTDYYLADVPNTMYFYEGYAIHGTYWHSNFGTPMSHGCVNLSISDSAWIFDFASVGTLVNVHY